MNSEKRKPFVPTRPENDPVYRDPKTNEPRREPWSAREWFEVSQRRRPKRAKM